jgi:TolB protein
MSDGDQPIEVAPDTAAPSDEIVRIPDTEIVRIPESEVVGAPAPVFTVPEAKPDLGPQRLAPVTRPHLRPKPRPIRDWAQRRRDVIVAISAVIVAGALVATLRLFSDDPKPAPVAVPPGGGPQAAVTCTDVPTTSATGASAQGGQVMVMAPDGTQVARLSFDGAADSHPGWSADCGSVSYVSDKFGSADVFVMRSDGTAPVRLTVGPSLENAPSISQDGSRVVFVSDRDGAVDLYTMAIDGSAVTRLTQDATAETHPEWSQDGTHIVFSAGAPGEADLFVMDADGSNAHAVLPLPGNEVDPAWSPDGDRIAFVSNAGGRTGDVYVVDANGNGLRLIRATPLAEERDPTWSADGKRLAFSADYGGNRDIWVAGIGSPSLKRLTKDPAPDRQPSWSPDGTRILFVRGETAPPAA